MSKARPVLAVGFDRRERVFDLAAALRAHGYKLIEAAAVRDLPVLLEKAWGAGPPWDEPNPGGDYG